MTYAAKADVDHWGRILEIGIEALSPRCFLVSRYRVQSITVGKFSLNLKQFFSQAKPDALGACFKIGQRFIAAL